MGPCVCGGPSHVVESDACDGKVVDTMANESMQG